MPITTRSPDSRGLSFHEEQAVSHSKTDVKLAEGQDDKVRKRILYLAHRVPYPPNKGDKIRSFNILKYLSQRHELHLAALIDDAKDIAVLPELRSQVTSLIYSRIDQAGRRLLSSRAILRSQSITVVHFYSRGLQSKIDDLIESTNFDVILCSSSPIAEYLFRSRHWNARLKDIVKIMDLIDVDSYKWQQYAQISSMAKAWVYRYEARKLEQYEKKIYRAFDKLLLVSDREKHYFPQPDNQNKIRAVQNGVDLDYFSDSSQRVPGSGGPAVVFTGMMDYWPNIEGVRWFIEEVYPAIRKAVPEVHFFVVGGRPSKEVSHWQSLDGVTVTGFVPDVRTYLGKEDVCIVPLQIARGIQNKVLEAMSMSKAIVSTPQALEGINLTLGEHALSALDAREFAAAVVGLLRDRQMADQIGQAARQFVEQHYSWEGNLRQLEEIILGKCLDTTR